MTAPSASIAGLLNTAGIATSGTNMFVGAIPDRITGLAILLLDFGGPDPVPSWTRDYRDVQILVRGDINGYANAYSKCEAIKNYLLGLSPQTIGTDIYASFLMRSDITFIGYDENARPK